MWGFFLFVSFVYKKVKRKVKGLEPYKKMSEEVERFKFTFPIAQDYTLVIKSSSAYNCDDLFSENLVPVKSAAQTFCTHK